MAIKNDRKDHKLRWELLPLPLMEDIVKVYTFGAEKYSANSWQNLDDGYNRYKAALFRHIVAYEKGEVLDKESNLPHLAHAAWNALAILYFSNKDNKQMTKEEAKKLIPVIQAYIEGKQIQSRVKDETISADAWFDDSNPAFDSLTEEYRIKPTSKYRPFKNAQECWQEMQKHQPFAWLKTKDHIEYYHYCTIANYTKFTDDFDEYTFIDGTPFGIKEQNT